MASITKRGKTYQYTVSHYVDGEYKPIRKGGFKTKREASVAAALIEGELAQGTQPIVKKTVFVDYFEEWIEDLKKVKSFSTYNKYRTNLRHVENTFGRIHMQDITKRQYQRFLNDFGESHALNTMKKLNSQIRACVKDAIDDGLIKVDFTRNVELNAKVESQKKTDKYLNYEDTKRLYQYVTDRVHLSHNYMLIALALVTGMRFGELLALTTDELDFQNNTINVWRAWDYKQGTGFTNLKNNVEAAERKITVDANTMRLLKKFISQRPTHITRLIFLDGQTNKGRGSNAAVNNLLKATLQKMDIPAIKFHGLRHTFVSMMLYRGHSIQWVSKHIGHSDINTTLKEYTHILKEMQEEEDKKAVYSLSDLTG